jgi:hypothetical protein
VVVSHNCELHTLKVTPPDSECMMHSQQLVFIWCSRGFEHLQLVTFKGDGTIFLQKYCTQTAIGSITPHGERLIEVRQS